MYPNNTFHEYFSDEFKRQKENVGIFHDRQKKPFLRGAAFIGTIFKLALVILKDAAIEIVLLVIFSQIVMKMAQGRDLIVSMFEPESLYGPTRIALTIIAVLTLSLSMWIIPAALFEWKKKLAARRHQNRDPFDQHLFFAHRILALVPFWLMAYALFNDYGLIFFGLSVLEVAAISTTYYLTDNPKIRKILLGILIAITSIMVLYFIKIYKVEYRFAKLILSVILYLASILVFIGYHHADRVVLQEHHTPKRNKKVFGKYRGNTIIYGGLLIGHFIVVMLIILSPRI